MYLPAHMHFLIISLFQNKFKEIIVNICMPKTLCMNAVAYSVKIVNLKVKMSSKKDSSIAVRRAPRR